MGQRIAVETASATSHIGRFQVESWVFIGCPLADLRNFLTCWVLKTGPCLGYDYMSKIQKYVAFNRGYDNT